MPACNFKIRHHSKISFLDHVITAAFTFVFMVNSNAIH
jgi:hypothetical protein